ncbi:MAG: DUF1800 domain-containing protein [Cyclobacteriaceae bacterium]
MNNPNLKSYHPKNYKELLKKYRKVAEVVLDPIDKTSRKRKAVATGLETYSGPWGDEEIMHLLKRCTFGVRKSDLQQYRELSFAEAITAALTQGSPPSPPVNDYNNAAESFIDPDVPYGETWIDAARNDTFTGERVVSLKNWLIQNMVTQPATIEEKMVFFWHNLLPTKAWDVFFPKLSYRYFEMLRRNAFGNFKTMIRELTLDPAMLLFLNGASNNKDAPDENYGRELQELFCIGKGPNAQFTEGDVQAAARVLTGWTFDWDSWDKDGVVNVVFNKWLHETSDKQFSSFYGNRLIQGRSDETGAEELNELLDMIFDNDETALFICRRFYSYFVYHEIDETTEANVIVPLAEVFRNNDYEIAPVIEALFSSAHFFDQANRGAMIKSPTEFLFGMWRTLQMTGLDSTDPADLKDQNSSLLWRMAGEGLEIADPPSVSGWPAYYQAPSFDKYWITTDTISNRGLTTDSMIYWGFWIRSGSQIPIDLIELLKEFDTPEDPNLMLEEASLLIHGIPPSEVEFAELKAILLSGQENDTYWNSAWLSLMNDPENTEYRLVVENRLKPTFQRLLQLGETNLF